MQTTLDFLIQHGYLVVFLWILLDQAGLPMPTEPLLIAAGALAGAGKLELVPLVALPVVASLLSDSAWFELGRRRGSRVLTFLCRISLEPDSCVRRTEDRFARHRVLTVVLGKFVPALGTIAPPLAGMTGMRWSVFLACDALGALIWTATFVVPGYLFSNQLEQLAERAALTGAWLLGLFVVIVALYVLTKFVHRQLFLRRLRVARVSPEELSNLLAGDVPPFVVDLRHRSHVETDPLVIPGAMHLTTEELEARHGEIPRDRDIVLYCT